MQRMIIFTSGHSFFTISENSIVLERESPLTLHFLYGPILVSIICAFPFFRLISSCILGSRLASVTVTSIHTIFLLQSLAILAGLSKWPSQLPSRANFC